jgi:hypothetical protein
MTLTESPARRFRPHPFRLAIPFAVLVGTLAYLGWWHPPALLFAAPLLAVVFTLVAFGNAGVVLSPSGIEWYAIRPGWRFRRVPWSAVRDVRAALFGFGNCITLTLDPGRYEPWAWGRVRPDRPIEVQLWRTTFVDGDELLDALRHFAITASK